MTEIPNPEKYSGERVQITLNKDVHERLELFRAYFETAVCKDEEARERLLEICNIDFFIDEAVSGYVDGIMNSLIGEDESDS